LAYLLYRFGAIIPPLIIAFILAYLLTPTANFFHEKLHFRRGLAIITTYLILFLILGFALRMVIPMIYRQVADIRINLFMSYVQARAFLASGFVVAGIPIDTRGLLNWLNSSYQNLLQPLFGSTLMVLRGIISSIAWIVLIVVISIYLIKDASRYSNWLDRLPPPDYRDDFLRIRNEISLIWSSFFRGQLLLAFVVACIFTTVSFAIGLRFALLMGVLAGLLEFLPSIGHGIWIVIGLCVAYFGGSNWIPIPHWGFALLVLGLHLIFEQVDMNYLIPRIIGRSVRLPALVVILGIISGAALAGVLGVMLAAPTIASLRVIGRYIYAQLVGMDPFPDNTTDPLPKPDLQWWHKRQKPSPKVGE
jgi:predicted PurR-regulated permease PerM